MSFIKSNKVSLIMWACFSVFLTLMVAGLIKSAENEARVTDEVLAELGLADGTEYSANIIGIRGSQNGISGDFYFGSGEVSGLDTTIVLVVQVSVGDADYIMSFVLSDVTFIQVNDIDGSTVTFDLDDSLYASRGDTVNDVLKRDFQGLVVRLSPDELERITSEMP